jgi:hypothetical protein
LSLYKNFVFKVIILIGAVAKKRLFWFCEALALCVGAKPNVPFVRLAKIVLKKCGGGKNKTRSVGQSCRKKVRC